MLWAGLKQIYYNAEDKRIAEPYENLYAPVEVLNAIVDSYKTGTGIFIKG